MQSSVQTITEPRSARLFMENSPRRRLLLSLVDRERSVAEVAAAEGLSIGAAHYLLTDFVRRGFAAVTREQKRAGRAIKYYRATACSYFVPLEFVSSSPGAGLAAEMRLLLDEALSRSDDEGVLFYVEDGDPRVSWFGGRERKMPVAEFWQILRLKEADAVELIEELKILLERYQKRSGEGRVFLIHSAVVPRRFELNPTGVFPQRPRSPRMGSA